MKKIYTAGLVLIPFFFIIYLIQFQPRATAVLSFWIGRNQIVPCHFLPANQTFFCREGNAKNIFASFMKNNQLLIDNKKQFSSADWLGLGIYLSELKFTSWEKIYPQYSEEVIKLIIDGFSFAETMSLTTFQITKLPDCQYFENRFQDACKFGIGRAIYFRENQDISKIIEKISGLEKHQSILRGIGFASLYAGNENINYSSNPNILEGRKIAGLFINPTSCNENVTHFLTCLDKN